MPLVVKQVAAPASEPVTLAELKNHLRVTFSDDDALIASLGVAARRHCEVLAKATFVNTTFDQVDDGFPFSGGFHNRTVRQFYGQFALGSSGGAFPGGLLNASGVIVFPRAPLVSVTSVTYLDANGQPQTLSPSEYVVTTGSPGRLAPAYGKIWPNTLPQIGAVTVRFVAGMGADASAVPENVKAAIKLAVGHWYANRVEVVLGRFHGEIPLGIEALLAPESWGSYA